MKRLFACLLLFTVISGNELLAQTREEKSVAEVVENLRKAMIDADKPTLGKLTSDDLSYGHSSGKIEDKATFIDGLVSGRSDFVTIDLSDQTIKITGNTAVVRHILNATNNDNGKPGTVKLSVLLVWQLQNKEWKLLARQAVKLQ